jgi:hypothetical protein
MFYIAMNILTEMYVFSRFYISQICLLNWLRPFISTNGTTQRIKRFWSNLILESFTKNYRATSVLISIEFRRSLEDLRAFLHAGTCVVCSVHIFHKAYGSRVDYIKHKWANVPELLLCACISALNNGLRTHAVITEVSFIYSYHYFSLDILL